MADLATPAAPSAPAPVSAPAAPSAPAPAPVSAPAPAAPAAGGEGQAPAAPAPVPVVPGVLQPGGASAKYDPQTAAAPPNSADYEQNSDGVAKFIAENSAWMEAHPEQAAKIRAAKLAAEGGELPEGQTTAEGSTADAIAAAEGKQPEEAKPAEAAAVAGATPAKIEEWTSNSAELKAAFEKNPELKAEIMETARFAESMKEVADIVSTKEEAQFAVEHAQRLVSLQTNWMLGAEDPQMVETAWEQTVEMFKERDAQGNEVKGPDGKPVLGADFKPFTRKAASNAMEEFTQSVQGQITALEARLAGNYATEEARSADATLLENAKYEKAAFEFVLAKLGSTEEGSSLPALPANATPEQAAFQKQLEEQQQKLNAQQGKQTVESRREASKTLDRTIQKEYEAGINRTIESHIEAMKARGEYLPEFVLTDKWINPQTNQPTNVSAFGAKVYLALNAKINSNPLHAAKLGSLQALGAAGKDARIAEINRLQTLYLPKIIQAEVTRIQDGIRASSGQKKEAGIVRMEPQSQGTVQPQAMDQTQYRAWAEGEAAKQPGFENMDARTKEQMIVSLAAKKKYGG